MRRLLLLSVIIGAAFAASAAWAQCTTQSSPQFPDGGNVFGRIASQWNAYFATKADSNGGTLCNPTLVNPAIKGGAFGNLAPHVAGYAPLSAASTLTYPNGVWRDYFKTSGDAAPLWYSPSVGSCSIGAVLTGSIAGTTLTVTGVSAGSIAVNSPLSGAGIAAGTYVVAQLTG
jgi:hypothetical protein